MKSDPPVNDAVLAQIPPVDQLRAYYRGCVERFLKTVMVIDDKAFDKRTISEPGVQPSDNTCTPTEGGVLTSPVNVDSALSVAPVGEIEPISPTNTNLDELISRAKAPIYSPAATTLQVAASHDLDGPALVRWFADKGILCAVEQPDQASDDDVILGQIGKLANTADVVVLDSALRTRDTRIARTAVENIIKADDEAGGRLRLIVIYTAELVGGVIDQLQGVMGLEPYTDKHIIGLRRRNTRVIVINKPGGTNIGVDAELLPSSIIDAYVELVNGLLPSSAVQAIGIIRGFTHHFLSVFTSDLDGAYIAHRCLIPNPEDAESFFIELYADGLRNLMSYGGAGDALSHDVCRFWVEAHCGGCSEPLRKAISDALEGYSSAVVTDLKALLKSDTESAAVVLMKLIYSPEDHSKPMLEMRYISDFARRSTDHVNLDEQPRLHLGAIVAVRTLNGAAAEQFEFLLCVQPRCDSLRLVEPRMFPFLKLKKVLSKADICVTWRDAVYQFAIEPSPKSLVMIEFGKVDEKAACVVASREGTDWEFTPTTDTGARLLWVGELRSYKAQKTASDLASRLHAPGYDEFEITRK